LFLPVAASIMVDKISSVLCIFHDERRPVV